MSIMTGKRSVFVHFPLSTYPIVGDVKHAKNLWVYFILLSTFRTFVLEFFRPLKDAIYNKVYDQQRCFSR